MNEGNLTIPRIATLREAADLTGLSYAVSSSGGAVIA